MSLSLLRGWGRSPRCALASTLLFGQTRDATDPPSRTVRRGVAALPPLCTPPARFPPLQPRRGGSLAALTDAAGGSHAARSLLRPASFTCKRAFCALHACSSCHVTLLVCRCLLVFQEPATESWVWQPCASPVLGDQLEGGSSPAPTLPPRLVSHPGRPTRCPHPLPQP